MVGVRSGRSRSRPRTCGLQAARFARAQVPKIRRRSKIPISSRLARSAHVMRLGRGMLRACVSLCQALLVALLVACSAAPAGSPERDAVDADGDASDTSPPVDSGQTCMRGHTCTEPDAQCTVSGLRCTCAFGAGHYWRCEDQDCPESITTGEACDAATAPSGCGAGFERPGYRCVAPEETWTQCSWIAIEPGSGRRWHCPHVPPAEGSTCCVLPNGPAPPPDECPYGSTTFHCVAEHWRLL